MNIKQLPYFMTVVYQFSQDLSHFRFNERGCSIRAVFLHEKLIKMKNRSILQKPP